METDSELRKLADFLEKENLSKYVNLPQIACMGDTSSGKSSVLTALSGIQFPSSEKLTTRCPTKLHMERSASDTCMKTTISIRWHELSEYADEKAFPIREVTNYPDITEAISRAQDCIIKQSGKDVAPDTIEVRLQSPSAVNLTLVDLPGIVRYAGKGESESLSEDIDKLMDIYLKNNRCIVLAIIPANVDFHNTEIMKKALINSKDRSSHNKARLNRSRSRRFC